MKTDLKITKRHQNVAADGTDGADDDQKRLHYLWRQTVFKFSGLCKLVHYNLFYFEPVYQSNPFYAY